ncbi:MAG TPA: outer membrane protein assembly factor BamE [Bauldia sp.]|nr:outer membrane protein assembly factor BamE [Bauldia sp.]
MRVKSPLLKASLAATLVTAAAILSGCQSTKSTAAPAAGQSGFLGMGETMQHGYVVSPDALQQIPVGSSKDQVLIALGSPSTTANYGNDVFYYISQTRYRAAQFLPDKIVDQRIVAVYFDKKDQVERVANYGLQDGKVFDFISKTTPTGGADESFLQQVLSGVVGLKGN